MCLLIATESENINRILIERILDIQYVDRLNKLLAFEFLLFICNSEKNPLNIFCTLPRKHQDVTLCRDFGGPIIGNLFYDKDRPPRLSRITEDRLTPKIATESISIYPKTRIEGQSISSYTQSELQYPICKGASISEPIFIQGKSKDRFFTIWKLSNLPIGPSLIRLRTTLRPWEPDINSDGETEYFRVKGAATIFNELKTLRMSHCFGDEHPDDLLSKILFNNIYPLFYGVIIVPPPRFFYRIDYGEVFPIGIDQISKNGVFYLSCSDPEREFSVTLKGPSQLA